MNRRRFLGGLFAAMVAPKALIEVAKRHPEKMWLGKLATPRLTEYDVIANELARVQTRIPLLFERDDTFFAAITKGDTTMAPRRDMRVALVARPGRNRRASSEDWFEEGAWS